MSLTNFPNGVSSFGFPLIGSGPVQTTGSVWFVNSATGQDASGRGTDPSRPFASIDFAVGQCGASKGDVIFAMPGHAETVSAAGGLSLDVAGVSVIGLGVGSNRPTITLGTLVTATIAMSAANCVINNCVIDLTGIDAITNGVVVTAANCTISNCRITGSNSTNQAAIDISLGSGADNFSLISSTVSNLDVGATSAIVAVAAVSGLVIQGCYIRGNYSTAILVNTSTFHITSMLIDRNWLYQSNGTAKAIFTLTTSSTGFISNNSLTGTTWASAADAISGGSNVALNFYQNFGFDAGGAASGVLVPAVGTIS